MKKNSLRKLQLDSLNDTLNTISKEAKHRYMRQFDAKKLLNKAVSF